MSRVLRICTWNIRGIHNPVKRRKILTFLKKGNIEIALLQETHLSDVEHLKLQQGVFGQIYFSSFTSRSRGVAILIKRNLPFKVLNCIKDRDGRYVIIEGVWQGKTILILNMYYPPAHPSDFVTKVFLDMIARPADLTIAGGDFNCVMNPLVDRHPHSSASLTAQARSLQNICHDLGFVDVWRTLHPADKEYTFFSTSYHCQSRLDYFFMPKTDLHLVLSCNIDSILLSDHASVTMELQFRNTVDYSIQWRLNIATIRDSAFSVYFSSEFKYFISVNSLSTDNPSLLWETCKVYARGLIISYTSSKNVKEWRIKGPWKLNYWLKKKCIIDLLQQIY